MNSTTSVRQLNRTEQGLLLEWAGREGWNPGRHDAELFWALDPDGYLGLEVAGQLVGGGAIIRHNQRFGFMGLFIVQPEFRTRKLGTQLWYARRDRLLERLEPGATIGLDAVDAMVPFYARGGFQAQGRHCRFEWRRSHGPEEVNPDIRPLDAIPFDQVVAFDAACFPGPREAFLRQWISQPEGYALGLVRNEQLLGLGVMRPCLVGWKIGPLFADSPATARQLLLAFGRKAGADPIYLDAPQNQPAAMELCQSLGMQEVFGCVRMYLGPPPVLAAERIFSITTFEVG